MAQRRAVADVTRDGRDRRNMCNWRAAPMMKSAVRQCAYQLWLPNESRMAWGSISSMTAWGMSMTASALDCRLLKHHARWDLCCSSTLYASCLAISTAICVRSSGLDLKAPPRAGKGRVYDGIHGNGVDGPPRRRGRHEPRGIDNVWPELTGEEHALNQRERRDDDNGILGEYDIDDVGERPWNGAPKRIGSGDQKKRAPNIRASTSAVWRTPPAAS
eukprot:scaffold13151_cov68-Phaeocystis_antarctica.AAC.2